jgi:UDP-N-acetylglucosamine--N-acetylmuramyl-(pentapeptide) pyrophosphoryl-undecaprenol N-acetylglucosamine transferase
MRVFFAAGGTAGHINPAIAIAQCIRQRDPDSAFLFVASPSGMEERLIREAGFETVPLRIRGLKRTLTIKNIKILSDAFKATARAESLLREYSPDFAFGTGGYVSYPVLRAAQKLKIPNFLHESNAIPGVTSKLLSRRADAVLLGFRDAARYFPNGTNCIHVGTPLRTDFQKANRSVARRKMGMKDGELLVVSFGGSLGADVLNQMCLKLMREGIEGAPPIHYLHATGKRNYESVMECLTAKNESLPDGCRILPYIDDMPSVLAAADLVICRAGASTLAELSGIGRASILIPYPHATADHQKYNALAMERLGGCIMVEEDENCYSHLRQAVQKVLTDSSARHRMELCAKQLQPPDCASVIMNTITLYLR